MRIRYEYERHRFRETVLDSLDGVKQGVQNAIKEAAVIAKAEGRADIAAAGFSKKWQNALRVDVYPRGRTSLEAAAVISHKIWYAGIFETGGTIQGKPNLWIPLPTAPKRIGSMKPTPKLMFAMGVKLFPFRSKKGSLLLGAKMNVSSAPRAQSSKRFTLSQLSAGRKGSRRAVKNRVNTLVPLFVAISQVTIRDRFSIREVAERVRGRLAELYYKHFKDT